MNGTPDTERRLADWLSSAAPGHAPRQVVDQAISAATHGRQRPRWLALMKEPPMQFPSTVVVGSPTLRFVSLVVATLVLVLAVAATVVAGASLLPSPAAVPSLPHNGLIAFDSGGDIVVAEPDGTSVHTLVGGPDVDTGPVWSPDGRQLAFWSQPGGAGPQRLGLVTADGTGAHYLVPPGPTTLSGYTGGHRKIEWAADGVRLALLTNEGGIEIVGLADGSWSALDVGSHEVTAFDMSPDGTRFAFVDPGSVYVTSPGATEATRVATGNGNELDFTSLEWSPTGGELVYTKARPSPDDPLTNVVDLYVYDTTSGSERRIVDGGAFFWPTWSLDGGRIAFGGIPPALHVAQADGSEPRELPSGGSEDITWSPDGEQLLTWGTDPATDATRLLVVDALGGHEPVMLDAPGAVGAPSWQPIP